MIDESLKKNAVQAGLGDQAAIRQAQRFPVCDPHIRMIGSVSHHAFKHAAAYQRHSVGKKRQPRIESAWTDADQTLAELYREFDLRGTKIKVLAGWQNGGETLRSGSRQGSNAQTSPDWDLSRPSTWNRDNLVTSPEKFDPINSLASTENSSEGLYGLVNISALADRLNLLGGVRRSQADGATRNLLTNAVTGTYAAQENSPQAGALFKITREVSAFVSYSESFVPQQATGSSMTFPSGRCLRLSAKEQTSALKPTS